MTNEQQTLQALTHLTGHDEDHFCISEDHGSAGVIFRDRNRTVYYVVTDAQFSAYEQGEVSKVKVLGSHLGLTVFSDLEEGISNEGTIGTTDVRPEDLAMAFKPDGSIIIVAAETISGNKSVEIVQTIGHLSVIRVYANAIQDGSASYYGDIFTSKADLLKEHPACTVLEGFCIHDCLTRYSPDDSDDWYATIEEASVYIHAQVAPDDSISNGVIIVSDEGYWNNDEGWMNVMGDATVFHDTAGLHLPIGKNCRWVSKSDLANVQPAKKTLPFIAVLDERGYCRLLGSSTGEMYDVVVDKVKTTDKAAAREIFRQRGHNIPEPPAPAGIQVKLTDQEVESLWITLTDVPFDEDDDSKELHLADDWYNFKKGTEREEIWHWFDANHSKGVAWLLYEFDKAASLEALVKMYILSRNPQADIVEVCLGYDNLGYKPWYTNRANDRNEFYLGTHDEGEAIRRMNLSLGRNIEPNQPLMASVQTKFEQIILVPDSKAAEMEKILSIEERCAEDYDRDGTIETFSTTFHTPYGDYGVDIKVCNGDTPYVDPVLFSISKNEAGQPVWSEMFPLDVEESLLGEYEFEFDESGTTVTLLVTVVKESDATIKRDITFRDTFAPTGIHYKQQYEGMKFTLVRELEAGKEYDKTEENPRMYEILLENNMKVHAFSDEIEV